MARRDELLDEIAREEFRLAALNAEVKESSARLAALRNEFAAEPSVQIVIPPAPVSVVPGSVAVPVVWVVVTASLGDILGSS